jgi:hypothetical protein
MLVVTNMRLKATLASVSLFAALAAGNVLAQAGLRVPERAEPGLDPAFARGWLAPEYDRFGFAQYQWREAAGASVGSRMMWSYSLGQRADFSMAYNSGGSRELDYERQVSLYGRWWFSPDWAVAGEAVSRDQPGFLPRVQDFRIGVQRRF